VFHQLKNRRFEESWFHESVFPLVRAAFEGDGIRTLLDSPSAVAKMGRAADQTNSLLKSTLFSLNPLFHANAVGVFSLFADMAPRDAVRTLGDIVKTAKATFGAARGESKGIVDFFNKFADPKRSWEMQLRLLSRTPQGVDLTAHTTRMVKSGLQFGHTIEGREGFRALQNLLSKSIDFLTERDVPSWLISPLQGIRTFNTISDRFLWQMVQNTVKSNAWTQIVHAEEARWLKKFPQRGLDPQALNMIDQEAAKHVNAAFGNMGWAALGKTPTAQHAARIALVAPDWTQSNIFVSRDLFVNLPGVVDKLKNAPFISTRDVLFPDLRFRAALGYHARAAFYTLLGASLLNYHFTQYKSKDGVGKWLWDNDDESFDERTGFKSRVELPWNRDDGRRQFMDVFKQFAEPMSLLHGPLDFYKTKMGVIPRLFRIGVLGQDAFGNPVYGERDGPYGRLMKSFGEMGAQFSPIVAQQIVRTAKGDLTVPASLISPLGFGIRSETKKGFQRRQRLQLLREQLKEANSL
jgi:hypothetical protein